MRLPPSSTTGIPAHHSRRRRCSLGPPGSISAAAVPVSDAGGDVDDISYVRVLEQNAVWTVSRWSPVTSRPFLDGAHQPWVPGQHSNVRLGDVPDLV